MKHHRYLSIPTILLASLVFFVSCQESVNDIPSAEDKDMTAALNLVDEELISIESNLPEDARANWRKPTCVVTVLKFDNKNSRLTYNTWNDEQKKYVEVTEEEITAILRPGDWMWHYRGGGLKALNLIEYDAASRAIVGNGIYEVRRNRLWLTKIPENCGEVTLKYDIVYDARNDGEGPIRLDPKIDVVD